MGRINGLKKGKQGEREAADWIYKKFDLANKPRRNLEQVRSGGFDLVDFPPFCIEVKRQESLALSTWWNQVVHSTTDEYYVPVVMYRKNRQPWRFLISAKHLGLDVGYIHLEAREFIKWANLLISS